MGDVLVQMTAIPPAGVALKKDATPGTTGCPADPHALYRVPDHRALRPRCHQHCVGVPQHTANYVLRWHR
jgi:hypothetical protein